MVMPTPKAGSSTPPVPPPPALANNPAALAAAMAAAGGGAIQRNPLGSGPLTSSTDIMAALVDTSLNTTGRYGVTGQPNYMGPMPRWLKSTGFDPQIYQRLKGSHNYDPWFGVITDQNDDRVYLGESPWQKTEKEYAGPFMQRPGMGDEFPSQTKKAVVKKGKQDKSVTIQQALSQPYGWDEDKVSKTIAEMNKSGFKVTSFDDMVNVWGQLVTRASGMYAYSEGKNKVSPWDVLSMYGHESMAANKQLDLLSQESNPLANATRTTVQKSVSDISQGDAWSVLQNSLSQMLGRDPSDRELRDFAYRMNQLAAKNPTVTRQTTKYDKNGNPVNSSSHTSAGFDANDLAEAAYNKAQSDPNYGEYQAASTYFNAALSALGPIGQV